jgi:hypothetical protein
MNYRYGFMWSHSDLRLANRNRKGGHKNDNEGPGHMVYRWGKDLKDLGVDIEYPLPWGGIDPIFSFEDEHSKTEVKPSMCRYC